MKREPSQVIILHGLGRSKRSMRRIETACMLAGYRVLNISYNSLLGSFEEILDSLVPTLTAWVDNERDLYLVGHSFGGILIRGLLSKHLPWRFKRCVMIGSPNQGASIAAYTGQHGLLKFFTPKVATELIPGSQLVTNLPEPSIDTGIIAGTKEFSPFIPVSWFYKKATNSAPGDGVVELSNTKCSNMSDFIEMPLHHSFMMWDSQLIEQILNFLKNGQFAHKHSGKSHVEVD